MITSIPRSYHVGDFMNEHAKSPSIASLVIEKAIVQCDFSPWLLWRSYLCCCGLATRNGMQLEV